MNEAPVDAAMPELPGGCDPVLTARKLRQEPVSTVSGISVAYSATLIPFTVHAQAKPGPAPLAPSLTGPPTRPRVAPRLR
jgi:hypothetical protein